MSSTPTGPLERRLTKGDDFDSEPSWSPDGERIVLSRGFELWLTKADGRTPRRLNRCGSEPDWSPDRRRIAFVCESEIYTIRPDGSGTTRLTKNDVDEIDPAWRTRNRLTFAAAPDDEIHSVRVAGGGRRQLTENAASDTSPSWSPDGRRIAFASGRLSEGDLFVMRSGGAPQQQLARLGARIARVVWSPNGSKVLAVNWSSPLSVVDLRGRVSRRGLAVDAAWSADGSQIASLGPSGVVSVISQDGGRRRVGGWTSMRKSTGGREDLGPRRKHDCRMARRTKQLPLLCDPSFRR